MNGESLGRERVKHMYLFVRLFFCYAFDQVLAWELALRFSCILLLVKTAIHRGKLINGRPVVCHIIPVPLKTQLTNSDMTNRIFFTKGREMGICGVAARMLY